MRITLLALLVSLTACDGGGAPEDGARADASLPGTDAPSTDAAGTDAPGLDAPSTTDAPVSGTGGCGMAHAAGFTCFDESFGGSARRYCVSIPEAYDPSVPRRIVLGLHGCGGSPEGAHRNTAPQVNAGSSDLLFVYPAALGSCWEYNASIDVEYVRHVLEVVAAQFCVDPSRAFADGMSSGGMMSSRLLCDGVVDSAAAISLNYACPTPHPVWLYGGTADEYFASYIEPGRLGWMATNGCSETSVPLPSGPCVEYQGCTERTIWCSDARGHVWPTDPWTTQIVDLFRSVR